MTEIPDHVAIRKRLLRPPNGRHSAETEIVGQAIWLRRQREKSDQYRCAIETARKVADEAIRRVRMDEAIRRAAEQHAESLGVARSLVAANKRLPKPPTVIQVIHAVSREFDISIVDMLSERRTNDVVLPRQVAMYLARKMTLKSLPEISKYVGRRDHTTCFHAVRKIEGLLLVDWDLADRVAKIRLQLSTAIVASCVSAQTGRGEETA